MCTISFMFSTTLCIGVRRTICFFGSSKNYTGMSTSHCDDYFAPPEAVRGCTKLDRSAFLRKFELSCVKVARPSLCASFLKQLSHVCLRCPFIKTIRNIPSLSGTKVRHSPSTVSPLWLFTFSFYFPHLFCNG